MKNNFLKKVAAIAFGVFAASAVTSSAFAWGSFALYDDSDGCDKGTVLEVSYSCVPIGTSSNGEAIFLCTQHKSCVPASGA